jgi:fibronectin type 3 domain-containing protein
LQQCGVVDVEAAEFDVAFVEAFTKHASFEGFESERNAATNAFTIAIARGCEAACLTTVAFATTVEVHARASVSAELTRCYGNLHPPWSGLAHYC